MQSLCFSLSVRPLLKVDNLGKYTLTSDHAEILHAPESTVVFLDQSAVFTCETVGGILSWVVNGTQREVIAPEIRRDLLISESVNDGGRTEEELTIPARAKYNGTRGQCLVFPLSGSDQSENATLLIQGTARAHCVHYNGTV